MKCQKCGKELSEDARFCGECGNTVDDDSNMAKNDSDSKPKNDSVILEKIPWYCQMWFISIVFWLGSFFFCIGPVAAVVLFAIRIIKYPKNRKLAIISGLVQIAIMILSIMCIAYASGAEDRAIKKYLDNNDVSGATNYISEHYSASSYLYYKKTADIYESVGDYDSAARTILDYCSIRDLSTIEEDVTNRLMKYKPNVSSEIALAIEEKNSEIVEAKSDREALEARAEQAESEAEAAKAEAEQAKADADAAKTETEQAKADAETAKNEAEQAKADADAAKTETEQAKADAENAKNEAEQAKADAEAKKTETEPTETVKEDNYNEDEEYLGDEVEADPVMSSSEIKSFVRDTSNIGYSVDFYATVSSVQGNWYILQLDDGQTAVYAKGSGYSSETILQGDYVYFYGVYDGLHEQNGWPMFTTVTIVLQ